MSRPQVDEIVGRVEAILGAHARVEIDLSDPRIADIASELRKARYLHPLSMKSIVVDLPAPGTGATVAIYRLGDVGAAPSGRGATAKAESDDDSLSIPKPKRHEHSYVPPKCVGDIILALADEKSHPIWFVGPTGCGKSVTGRYIAEAMGYKFFEINCHGQMDVEEVVGEKDVEIDAATAQNHIVWLEGIIEQAMTCGLDEDGNEVGNPGLLLVDEAAGMPAHVGIALNRPLESDDPRRTLVLTRDGGRVVRSHSKFRVIFAGNTTGRGATSSHKAAYTAQLDAHDLSTLNRIAFTFPFGYSRSVEKRILQEKIEDDGVSRLILELRDAVRAAIRSGELATPISTRTLVTIADGYRIYGDMGKAVFYSFYGKLLEEEVPVVNEICQRILGTDPLADMLDDDVDYM